MSAQPVLGTFIAPFPESAKPRLLDQVRQAIRVRHYSIRTEEAYVNWARRFILFHNKRHPIAMGPREINQFLTHLAGAGHVSASTQNQAFAAILFLYEKVLDVDPGRIEGVIRAKRPHRLPVVFTKPEIRLVLAQLSDTYLLIARILYGAGLRLLECLRLRVKDVESIGTMPSARSGVFRRAAERVLKATGAGTLFPGGRTLFRAPAFYPRRRHFASVAAVFPLGILLYRYTLIQVSSMPIFVRRLP